jgi:hypothetical protein
LQWTEYGKADKRWEVYDPTVLSLELLTVFIMGPLALLAMYGVSLQLVHDALSRSHYTLKP